MSVTFGEGFFVMWDADLFKLPVDIYSVMQDARNLQYASIETIEYDLFSFRKALNPGAMSALDLPECSYSPALPYGLNQAIDQERISLYAAYCENGNQDRAPQFHYQIMKA